MPPTSLFFTTAIPSSISAPLCAKPHPHRTPATIAAQPRRWLDSPPPPPKLAAGEHPGPPLHLLNHHQRSTAPCSAGAPNFIGRRRHSTPPEIFATVPSFHATRDLRHRAVLPRHPRSSPWPPLPHRDSTASTRAPTRRPTCSPVSAPLPLVASPRWPEPPTRSTDWRPSPPVFQYENKYENPRKTPDLTFSP
jgi:hypothetical protein